MHHSLPECCNQRTDLARPDRARTALLPLSTLTSTPCSLSFPPTIHHLPSLAVSLSNPSLDSASATTYYYYSYYYRAYETLLLLLLLSLLLLLLLLPLQYFLLSPPQPPSVTIEAIPDICQRILSRLLMVPLQLQPELRQRWVEKEKWEHFSPFTPHRAAAAALRHLLPHYRRSLCLRAR